MSNFIISPAVPMDRALSNLNATMGSMNPASSPKEEKQTSRTIETLSAKVTISEEAIRRLVESQKENKGPKPGVGIADEQISAEEGREIKKLAARDQEVRDHERAHMMAGGILVRRGASYQYTTGPDGKRYAVAGEVSIDSSEVSDNPQATITKMQQVRRAALAPAEPSTQDRSVATSASQKEAQARQELRQQGLKEY